jgi:AcrR family transcriptional regulator
LELFSEKGSRATLAEIALRADVNEITIYRHFNAGSLWSSVLKLPSMQLDSFYENLRIVSEADPLPPVEDMVRASYHILDTHPYSLSLIHHAWVEQRDTPTQEFLRQHWKNVMTPLTRYFTRGVAEGLFQDIDPWILGRTLWSTVIYEEITSRPVPKHPLPDRAKRVQRMVQLFEALASRRTA